MGLAVISSGAGGAPRPGNQPFKTEILLALDFRSATIKNWASEMDIWLKKFSPELAQHRNLQVLVPPDWGTYPSD